MKTKVLLHQLGRKELVGWVNLELNGYPDDIRVPEYRILTVQVKGNLSNNAYTYNDQPLPTAHLGEEIQLQLARYGARESISALEELARKDTQGLVIPIAPEFYGLLSKPLTGYYQVQRAWRAIGPGQLAQILTQVRSRLLDFVLELSEKVGEQMTAEDIKRVGQSPDTTSMFNNAIFGDNATILVGDQNRQTVANRITRGDFEALKSLLQERNVPVVDIEDLRSAIKADDDGEDVKAKRFGPRVRDWMKSMLSKAIDTSWQIEIGIASNLLTDALKAYYGW
jgi:AbiTii